MKTLDIPQELRDKMFRRAERAFDLYDQGSDEHVTRCSDVTRDSLRYRISHKIAGTCGEYSGPKVLIHRVFPKSKRKWYNPLSWFRSKKPYILVPEVVGDGDHIIDHTPKLGIVQEPLALPAPKDEAAKDEVASKDVAAEQHRRDMAGTGFYVAQEEQPKGIDPNLIAVIKGIDALSAGVDGPDAPHRTITMLPPPDADHQWYEKTSTLPDPDDSDTDLTSIESV